MYREVSEQGGRWRSATAPAGAAPKGDLPYGEVYATRFTDAWQAAHYTAANLARLEGDSRKFHAAFSSTLPSAVLDAVAANITVLRSPTCFRLEDGTLMAWEGCFDEEGCWRATAPMSSTTARPSPSSFPELEQSMRRLEYQVETLPDGKMNFRSYQPFGMDGHDHMPAADGQLGTIVRLYREWKFSGDDAFLRQVWSLPRRHSTLPSNTGTVTAILSSTPTSSTPTTSPSRAPAR